MNCWCRRSGGTAAPLTQGARGCLGEVFNHSTPWRLKVHHGTWWHFCVGNFLLPNFGFLLFSLHCGPQQAQLPPKLPGCPILPRWMLRGQCYSFFSKLLSSSKESPHTWRHQKSISSRNGGNWGYSLGMLLGKNRNFISLAHLGTKMMI